MNFMVMYESDYKYIGFKPMPASAFTEETQKRIIEEITAATTKEDSDDGHEEMHTV